MAPHVDAASDGGTLWNGARQARTLILKSEPERCKRLWTSAIVAGSRGKAVRLHDTYYDTPDHRLRDKGFTLRVRREGSSCRQILEAEAQGEAGTRHTREWSAPITGSFPELAGLGSAKVLERIGLILPGELQPTFSVSLTRRFAQYAAADEAGGEDRFEATLDVGEIVAGARRQPISELVLTSVDGAPGTLQKEAARLHRIEPMELEASPIERRGAALTFDEHPLGTKTSPRRFNKRISLDEALSRVLGGCMRHMLANYDAAIDGTDIEGVHQMRVALRRLRTAVSMFKTVLPPDDVRWLQSRSKSLIDVLGAARDWDVFSDELLRPVVCAHPDNVVLATLRTAVERQRELAYERVRSTLRAPEYLTFVLDLAYWLESRGWRRRAATLDFDQPLVQLARKALNKRHRKTLKLGRDFDGLSDDALHQVRIALKKLRYSAEFFAPLYRKKDTRPYLAALQRLQDDLGRLNDIAVAERRLDALCRKARGKTAEALTSASALMLGWYAHALAERRPRIADDWRAFAGTAAFWRPPKSRGES